MLYRNAEIALLRMMERTTTIEGEAALTFNLKTGKVDDARFIYTSTDPLKDISEDHYVIIVDVVQADPKFISARCAAVTAVDSLRELVNVEGLLDEKPSLYGTMLVPQDEYAPPRAIPYDERLLGFLYDDCYIHDPTISECGRFSVDPRDYGFKPAADGSGRLTRSTDDGGELQLTGPAMTGGPKADDSKNVLIRVSPDGEVLAYSSIDQIPTGDDYQEPDYLRTTNVRYRIDNADGQNHGDIGNAFTLLLGEGIYLAYQNWKEGSIGEAGTLAFLEATGPWIEDLPDSSGSKDLTLCVRSWADQSSEEIMRAVDSALKSGLEQLVNIQGAGFADLAKQLRFSCLDSAVAETPYQGEHYDPCR